MKPLQTGLALSATVALFYTLCTVVEVMWPDQFMGFMNALFHGLDFRKLMTSDAYDWSSFFYALVLMTIWAFALGFFFALIHNALSGVRRRIHMMQHE
jgi:hypothetical protein